MAFQTECKMSHKILSLNNWFLRESKAKDAKVSLGIFTSHKQNLKIQKYFKTQLISQLPPIKNSTYFFRLPDSFWFDSKLPHSNSITSSMEK